MNGKLHIDDLALVEECKKGDREAMSLLYKRYAPRMLHIIRRYVTNPSYAQDILHDGFVVALTRLDTLRDTHKFEFWLATIMKNLSLKYLQSQDIVTILHELPEIEEDADIEDILDYEVLESLIAKLPAGYQRVFRLAVLANKSHKEISKILGIAPNSSSSQLFHARLQLQKLVKDYKLRNGIISLLIISALSGLILKLRQSARHGLKETSSDQTVAAIDPKPKHNPESGETSVPIGQSIPSPYNNNNLAFAGVAQSSISPVLLRNTPEENGASSNLNIIPPGSQETSEHPDSTLSIPLTLSDNPEMEVASETIEVLEDSLIYYNIKEMLYPAFSEHALASTDSGNWRAGLQFNSDIYSFDNSFDKSQIPDIADNPTNMPPGVIESLVSQPHKNSLPVSVGLTLEKRFSRTVSLETGVGYNYLHTVFDNGYRTTDCRWHYLEIPLKLNLSLIKAQYFNVYGTVKTDMNIPVYSVASMQNNWGPSYFIKGKFNSKPVFSIGGGMGVSVNISRHIDVFVEPTLKYHFNNNDEVPNRWSDEPFSISIPIGIRLKW